MADLTRTLRLTVALTVTAVLGAVTSCANGTGGSNDLDLEAMEVTDTVTLPGLDAFSLDPVFDETTGDLFVHSGDAGELLVVDARRRAVDEVLNPDEELAPVGSIGAMTLADRRLILLDQSTDTLSSLDLNSRDVVSSFDAGLEAVQLAGTGGESFVVTSVNPRQTVRADAEGLLGSPARVPASDQSPVAVVATDDTAWLAFPTRELDSGQVSESALMKLDAEGRELDTTLVSGEVDALVLGDDALYALADDRLLQVDRDTLEIIDSIDLGEFRPEPDSLTSGGGGVFFVGEKASESESREDEGLAPLSREVSATVFILAAEDLQTVRRVPIDLSDISDTEAIRSAVAGDSLWVFASTMQDHGDGQAFVLGAPSNPNSE